MNETEKIKEPEDMKLMYEETIGRTKIDTNNHLNNLYHYGLYISTIVGEIKGIDKKIINEKYL